MEKMKKNRGIVFMAWGTKYVEEIKKLIQESQLPDYPLFLVTDEHTQVDGFDNRLHVIRTVFELDGKARKCELGKHLPEGLDSILFLDVDTRILDDISLGFEKAEKYGIAMAQAAHYSLDHFKNFSRIMVLEGIKPRGQLLYNSGVIFFSLTPCVREVFELWTKLGVKYPDAPWGDQTYLTLAMELLDFVPYTLSTGYNHRAFGELISGEIRIWHSFKPVPENVNDLNPVFPRRYEGGKIVPVN
jgi:hypothetical protein